MQNVNTKAIADFFFMTDRNRNRDG